MKTLVLLLFCLLGVTATAQIDLTIEDSTAVNTDPNAGPLIDIPRDVPTNLIFRNNSLTSNVKNSYMLRCGDDLPRGNNNNLDGAIISGNYFDYTGTDPSAFCHGVMMGYNIDYHFRYNYCKWIPFGLVYEGIEGMTTTEGGTYYNVLHKGRTNQIILNGQNGVPVYNNTLYSSRSSFSFITVKVLGQVTPTATSNNIKIKNNIFYSVEDNTFISVDDSALVTLECDYNVYWCENSVDNEPRFQNISTYEFYTWDEWRALGFDQHSVIINPNFIDTENLVPAARLDYGTDLGSAYDEGLAIDAVWDVGEYPNTTKQNGTWQVGAYVYSSTSPTQTPTAPSGLSLNYATTSEVSISWVDNSNDESGFEIERSNSPDTGFGTIHTSTGDEISYLDDAVIPVMTYYYRVRAVNEYGESDYTQVLAVTTPAVQTTGRTIGNTEIFSGISTNSARRALPFTVSEDGDIQSISIYHNGGSDGSGLLLGVYDDQSALPSNLLGVTPVSVINTVEGWQTVDLVNPISITAGQTIWLAWVFENNPGIRFQAGSPGRAQANSAWSGSMPIEFGPLILGDYIYSIYCTYRTYGGGTTPTAPLGLSLNYATTSEVSISWVDNSNDESGFEIERSNSPDTGFGTIHTSAGDEISYLDDVVLPAMTYYYRVRAVNEYGESDYTQVLAVTTPAEQTVSKTIGNTEIFSGISTNSARRALPFTMFEDGDIQSISIYHNGGSDGSGLLLGVYDDQSALPSNLLGVTPVSVIITVEGWQTVDLVNPISITAGQTIWLAWVFENNPGIRYQAGSPGRAQANSAWSGSMPIEFGPLILGDYIYSIYCTYRTSGGGTTPTAPSGLSLNYATTSEVSISWVDNSNDESGFEIERSDSPGTDFVTIHTTPFDETSYQDVTVLPVMTYYYKVRAINEYGESAYTQELEVTTPAEQTVSTTLGNTEIFSDVSTNGTRRALPFTMSEDGDIQSISIYHNGGSDGSRMLLGVYDDQSALPSSLLGVTPVSVINTVEGWQTVDLVNPISITAGQTIWLAWVFENNPGIRYQAGSPGRAQSPETWAGGIPSTFGNAYFSNYIYSIYATYSTILKGSNTKSKTVGVGVETKPENIETLLVYPNPTSGSLNVIWSNTYDSEIVLTVYNLLGQVILQKQIEPRINRIRLDLTGEYHGIYLLELRERKSNRIINKTKILKK